MKSGIRKKQNYQGKKENVKKEIVKRSAYLENISGAFGLSEDILEGEARISIIGKSRIRIENYKALIDYDETEIKILTKCGKIRIEGMQMVMKYCTDMEIHITGKITGIFLK